MTSDYKSTVFLPKTEFPMKAGLPKQEPKTLERWKTIDLWRRLREDAADRELFVLHDGPPYANGNIHIGTALNKILKDVVNRSQQMVGKNANYVPGWDCHGLPIEWQVEQRYRDAGRDKDEVPILEFRQECREFAEHWIEEQRKEFIRLGCAGDWFAPYATMQKASEAQIVREICSFLMNGGLYKGAKPVLWSVVEKTALAEAEVEYMDHNSTTVSVRFPVLDGSEVGAGASIVIWTTTPWTLPGNRAIAFKPDADYVRMRIDVVAEESLARVGEEIIVAQPLVEAVCEESGISDYTVATSFKGAALKGTCCAHPFRGQGYDFDVVVLAAEFVDMEQGTGFVHIAPGHGADDFELGSRHGIDVPRTVDDGGRYYPEVPLFAGKHVFKVDGEIADALTEAKALLARNQIHHSYPHSWRSKAPLIFRNTPQWFISMDANDLRKKALVAIDNVRWVPTAGRNRIYAMIEDRPEWVISRQRAWGVPITVFVEKETGEPLQDEEVNERIIAAVSERGTDVWFESDGAEFLGQSYDVGDYEKVNDIVDVWFESGSTHSFVLEQRDDLRWPADLYLEGSDQHRGWFHSSLLESCGTRGRAPYGTVLTHGFVVDGEGRKMSKSLGNVVAPQEIIDRHGAEILRIWVVSSDYSEDLRIGSEIVQRQVDAYRRLRNTFRFLLGNLAGFDDSERLDQCQLPALERWVRHRLWELDAQVRQNVDDFRFHEMFNSLYNFCTVDLSAFYFDVRKDSLYCDGATSLRRHAVRTVLDDLFKVLTAWLAPVLCFTAEEAWLTRFPSEEGSVHFQQFPMIPSEWRDERLAASWERVRRVRRVVTGALEAERQAKRMGSSLQAHPTVYVSTEDAKALSEIDLPEIALTSAATIIAANPPDGAFRLEEVEGVGVIIGIAEGTKCERCWQVLPDVGSNSEYVDICGRCADVVAAAS